MCIPANPTFSYIKWVFPECSLHGLVNVMIKATICLY